MSSKLKNSRKKKKNMENLSLKEKEEHLEKGKLRERA